MTFFNPTLKITNILLLLLLNGLRIEAFVELTSPSRLNNINNGIGNNSSTSLTTLARETLFGKIRTYKNGYVLTHEEEIALEIFRPLVEPYLYAYWMRGDNLLIKFLRARDLDVDAATTMVKRTIQWRKSNQIDKLVKADYRKWEKLFPFISSGVDKQYGPVFYFVIGAYDLRKAIVSGHYDTLRRFYDRSFETAIQLGRQMYESDGQNVALQGTLILDFAGFNFRKHACVGCLQIFLHMIQSYEANYPQIVSHMILINAPKNVERILSVKRPLVSKHTAEALEVFGADQTEWEPVLKKYINSDQLLIRYGGTRQLDTFTSATLG